MNDSNRFSDPTIAGCGCLVAAFLPVALGFLLAAVNIIGIGEPIFVMIWLMGTVPIALIILIIGIAIDLKKGARKE